MEGAPRRLDGVVHIYHAPTSRPGPWRERARAVLSSEEWQCCAQLKFQEDRDAYLVAHCLLRHALTRHGCASPREWRFEKEEHGRPQISGPDLASRLRFNLTHTPGRVACAVTRELDVGVDVEHRERSLQGIDVARHVLSPTEREDLASRRGEARRRRFFEYWTLKESYVKATGKGLSVPLTAITLKLDGPSPSIVFDAPLDDDAQSWSFHSVELPSRHLLASAVRSKERASFRVRLVETPDVWAWPSDS